MPIQIDPSRFDLMVRHAIEGLPERFRAAMEVVRVEVRDRPTSTQLAAVGLLESDLLLGLYEGIPLTERSVNDGPHVPDVIFLFREDLEDACDDLAMLEREVRVTLLHELGHYFGFDEDELDRLGYG